MSVNAGRRVLNTRYSEGWGCPVMTFLATSDGVRARAFYEQALGLKFVEDSEHALAFDLGGTMLRIQKVPQRWGANGKP